MTFRALLGFLAAVLSAALAPALAAGLTGGFGVAVLAFYVALGFVLVLGLPLFLFLRGQPWMNAFTCAVAGFLVGAIPIAMLTFPLQNGVTHSEANGVVLIEDGVPTFAGWLSYIAIDVMTGVFGAIGATAFWFVLKWTRALPEPKASKTSEPA